MSNYTQRGGSLGLLWFVGWLFTLGFLKQGFWQGLLAILVWPYFLGVHFADSAVEEPAGPAPAGQIEVE